MIIEPGGTNQAVTGAIRQAARMTGADFKYLLATAQVESNLNPNARASTSTARGLFQFTEQTWLATLKEQGPALGYGPYASAISRQPFGDYAVADPRMSEAVMNLRSDPTANSVMAGAFTNLNAGKLAGRLGRNPTEGELYIAHFLGPTGASRLISLADSKPMTAAAAVFPGAARANPTIFYNGRGQARSASEVYHLLVGRYDVARGGAVVPQPAVVDNASVAPSNNRSAFVPVPKPTPKPALLPEPEPESLTETYAAAALTTPPAQPAGTGAMFYGLFRTGGGPEPVAPLVNSLWTSPQRPEGAATAAPVAATAAGPAAQAGGDLGLFQDQLPDARALFRGRV